MNETWRYALVGGLASILFTIVLYWSSGLENAFPLNTVFFGGLLAGSLAYGEVSTVGRVGLLAGVIGGLPGPLILFDWPPAVAEMIGLSTFHTVIIAITRGILVVVLFVVAGVAGFLGTLFGWRLARTVGGREPTVAGQ